MAISEEQKQKMQQGRKEAKAKREEDAKAYNEKCEKINAFLGELNISKQECINILKDLLKIEEEESNKKRIKELNKKKKEIEQELKKVKKELNELQPNNEGNNITSMEV